MAFDLLLQQHVGSYRAQALRIAVDKKRNGTALDQLVSNGVDRSVLDERREKVEERAREMTYVGE